MENRIGFSIACFIMGIVVLLVSIIFLRIGEIDSIRGWVTGFIVAGIILITFGLGLLIKEISEGQDQ